MRKRTQIPECLRAYYAGSAYEMGQQALRDQARGTFIAGHKKPRFYAVAPLPLGHFGPLFHLQVKVQNMVVVGATCDLRYGHAFKTLVATCRPQEVLS